MKILFFIVFIFFLIIEKAISQSACVESNIGKYFSECLDKVQNIYFYWIENCNISDPSSIQLPVSLLNTSCQECEEGKVIDYSFKENKIICDTCLSAQTEANNFKIEGRLNQWKNFTTFSEQRMTEGQYSNLCFIEKINGDIEENGCTAFIASQDGSYFFTNSIGAVGNTYYAELSYGMQFVKKGKISFRYQKINKSQNSFYNGSFRFLINYVDRLTDLYTTSTMDWVEVSFPIEPGFYTFLWQYNKLLNSDSDPKKMMLKLEMIQFEGIQADNDHSLNFLENHKKENNRPQCLARDYNFGCPVNSYFDKISNKCLLCPEGYFSPRKSTDKESCLRKPPCKEEDYIYNKSNLCPSLSNNSSDQSQKTQLVEYFYNTPFNCIESTGVKKPENKYVPCAECAIGQFRKSNLDTKSSKCEYCPVDLYSDEINTQGLCKKCEDGYTPRILEVTQGNFYQDVVDSLFYVNKNWTLSNNNLVLKRNDFSFSSPPKLEMNVTITEPLGNLQIKYQFLTYSDIYNFTLNIYNYESSKTEYLHFSSSWGNYTFNQDLKKGKYKISLELNIVSTDNGISWTTLGLVKKDMIKSNQPIVKLQSLTIKNSLLGGGYTCSKCPENMVIHHASNSCVKCPSGTEIDEQTKTCVPCKEGFIRDSTSDQDSYKCLRCPDLTTSNSKKDDCILLDIMQNKNSSLRFIINDLYETEQKIICDSGDSLCYDSFLGPISSNSELYFLSFREKSSANFSDFSYEIKNTDSAKGFVFSLKKDNTNSSKKTLLNMGKVFSYIKLFRNRKGLAIKYTEGDVCQEDPSQRYSTILIIKCYKEFDSIYSVETPKLLTKTNNNCTNVLQWRSRHACPSCLKTEALSVALPCRGGERWVYYRDNKECTINSPLGKSGNFMNFDNLPYAEDEKELNFYFENEKSRNLEEEEKSSTQSYENTDYPYVDLNKFTETCQIYEDFDQIVLTIIIAVPICYFTLAICLICYCVKLRKISNQYHRLREENSGSDSSGRKYNQQLELGNSVISKKENL